MWTYEVTSGKLINPDGTCVGEGYSGNGAGLNNVEMENVPMRGPIPAGKWTIGRFFDDPGDKGPIVAHLTPQEGTDAYARSGFMIHGDNSALDHSASEGCVILPHALREMLMASNDRTLNVTS